MKKPYETHGLARVRRVAMAASNETQTVRVTDGDGMVVLGMSTSGYPAGLTTDEARFIAAALTASADRVDAHEAAGRGLDAHEAADGA